jgi:hypothetical protein
MISSEINHESGSAFAAPEPTFEDGTDGRSASNVSDAIRNLVQKL